jgi:DNA (cytosine-5)-methyltransferase 1
MAEVRAAAGTNGLMVASLFAGCGGSSVGYKLAGFRVVYANEWDRVAADSYEANADGLQVDRRSVEEVIGGEIATAAGGELDVLDGSPPCQDFSLAGERDLSGEEAQRYYQAVRLVGEVRPRAFVFENVRGFASEPSLTRHFIPIRDALRRHGYRVVDRILDGSRLGVPQKRQRVILVGVRRDLGLDPAEAIPHYGRPTVIADALPEVLRLVVPEGEDIPEGHYGWRGREKTWPASRPGPTVAASGIGIWRATATLVELRDHTRRLPTIAEVAALCGFPADFVLPASPSAAWRVLGNAVPPPMARSWASGLRDLLTAAPR